MHAFIITDDDKAGVTVDGDLLHEGADSLRVVQANLLAQIGHQRNLFGLNFRPGAHFLIQLAAGVEIIIDPKQSE